MKKLFVMLLAVSMLLSLCACGKSEEVINVESLISTIGTVSLKSEDAILEAEKAYKALPADDKEKVSNYADLETARGSYEDLTQALEEALYSYIVSQPERNGCIFDKLTVSSITVNSDNITVSGTVTFSSDNKYTCEYIAKVSETDDISNPIKVESWEDDFDEVYKDAQPVHWEVAYYVDEFGDDTDEWYIRGIFEGDFDNSAGYGHDLTVVLFFDQYLDKASYDYFYLRLLEYGNIPANLSGDADDVTIKIKVDGTVYSDEADMILENDIVIQRGSEIFSGVIDGLNAGKEVSFIIEESYYGNTSSYNFKIDAFGLDDIPHSWKARM